MEGAPWYAVAPALLCSCLWSPSPRCDPVHLGDNDLTQHCRKALIIDVIRDLTWLRATYPTMHVVWSAIVPQLARRDARNFLPINTAWRSVNREVCRAVCSTLGSVMGHQRICMDRPELFRSGGVPPSEQGLDVFLGDIKGGLLLELDKLDGGHGT